MVAAEIHLVADGTLHEDAMRWESLAESVAKVYEVHVLCGAQDLDRALRVSMLR